MKFNETLISALTALRANKMRSFLTMLGVIIGVFSVVSLVSLVKGVQNYVTDQFSALGSNLIFITPGKTGLNRDPSYTFTGNKLAKKHVELIQKYASDYIVDITPVITVGKSATFKTRSYYSGVNGVNERYSVISDIKLSKGRFFTQVEERANAKVAVLGYKVEKELFSGINPIGKKIEMNNQLFEVIGVFDQKTKDTDESITIPDTTMERELKVEEYSFLDIKVKSNVDMDVAAKTIQTALLRDLKDDEFTLFTQKDLLKTIQNILQILSLGLGAIAAISLLVGGIGIMNIMLVSVTERVQEIGLRKALGATNVNIGLQFLLEAVMISITGGLIGLSLGFGASLVAQRWIRAEVPWWTVILALGFSVFVGVIFGTYPAIQASKKDPIEALRYE
jgi:putative ABC transport system permease protein